MGGLNLVNSGSGRSGVNPLLGCRDREGPIWPSGTLRPSSKLALLRLLAPLVNFSCHDSPSFRHSSVMTSHLAQQARNGTVRAPSFLPLLISQMGREVLRIGLGRVVHGGNEDGVRCTRHGERGFGCQDGDVIRPRLGEREINLNPSSVSTIFHPAETRTNAPRYRDLEHDMSVLRVERRATFRLGI